MIGQKFLWLREFESNSSKFNILSSIMQERLYTVIIRVVCVFFYRSVVARRKLPISCLTNRLGSPEIYLLYLLIMRDFSQASYDYIRILWWWYLSSIPFDTSYDALGAYLNHDIHVLNPLPNVLLNTHIVKH